MEIDSRSPRRRITEIAREIVYQTAGQRDPARIMLGVSYRHVHLCEEDFRTLFGPDAALTIKKSLRQSGIFAADQTVTVIGPNGSFDRVRIIGPLKAQTVVELAATDCHQLGIDPMVWECLGKAAPIILEGPYGRIKKENAATVAQRHIHLSPTDAAALGLADNDLVSVEFAGPRGGILDNFRCRVSDAWCAEVHIDSDEANALGARSGDMVRVILND